MILRNSISACKEWVRSTSPQKLRLIVIVASVLFWLAVIGLVFL